MTSIWCEILPVTLEAGQVVWLCRRAEGEAHPWRIAHQAGRHPNDVVLAHVERCFGEGFEPEASILHSTSWRCGPRTDRLLLTYLVVFPQGVWVFCRARMEEMVAEPVGKGEPVRGDHLHPPGRMEMNSILAHALDHLAWLKGSDERIKAVLEAGWGEVLERRPPKPAGYLAPTGHS